MLRRASLGVAVFVRNLCAVHGSNVTWPSPLLVALSAARCDKLAFSAESVPPALIGPGIAQDPLEGEEEQRLSRKETLQRKEGINT
ncbi:hypothetical protein EDD16DRAFT_1630567, partial [Pisolithus croceorrhizus]